MNTESEINKLGTLRNRYATVNAAIVQARNEIARCNREIGEIRIAAALDSEANPPKVVEARCKKIELELKAAQTEIEKLTPEGAALSGAIDHLEREITPKRHAERLNKQAGLRERYRAIARKILEAANALAALSAEAKSILDSASAEFPRDEECEGQGLVNRSAGLAEIWDPAWISYEQGSRRDLVVGMIWEWDRTLVGDDDPVSIQKLNWEHWFQGMLAENERIRQAREVGSHAKDPHPLGFEVRYR